MYMRNYITHHTQRGSTLFYTILVSGLFLLVALGLSDIALQETQFSAFSRDSQTAFYAADTGVECATYWDYVDPTASVFHSDGSPPDGFSCINRDIDDGADYQVTAASGPVWQHATTTFWIPFASSDNEPCVQVEVGKYEHPTGNTKTVIIARGYNIADNTAVLSRCNAATTQSRRVQRALRVQYGFDI